MLKARHRINTTSQSAVAAVAIALLLSAAGSAFSQTRRQRARPSGEQISKALMLQIVRAEDERRWDGDLITLFNHRSSAVRRRAALAAGRIGDANAVSELDKLFQDEDSDVREMAAFALGEVESLSSAPALVARLKETDDRIMRGRILEALGKIAAAVPKEAEASAQESRNAVLEALKSEAQRRSAPDKMTILLGLTAALRARPANSGPTIAQFLTFPDPRIRADAGNTLARLRLNDGNSLLRRLLMSDPDPVVRANAARVLGATEDKESFEKLLDRSLNDADSRVRVSAIRALASLKDGRATRPLMDRGSILLVAATKNATLAGSPAAEVNELLDIVSAVSRLQQHSDDERTVRWLRELRPAIGLGAPELEIAFARISPAAYLGQLGTGPVARRKAQELLLINWRAASSFAQGLGGIATAPDSNSENKASREQAADMLRGMLDYRNSGITINTLVAVHSEYAIPDVLRAFAAHKPKDLADVLRKHLKESDAIIRGTAADLLAELPPDEANGRALIEALPTALRDKELNDAALSILDGLAKQKNSQANEAILSALNSDDHLIRRRAVALLKANGAGDHSSRIGTVKTLNTVADYQRAISRIGKPVNAVVSTSKGPFTIALLPGEAPLTVDNFIKLAKRGYFRGIVVHRVVPNFVIQDGDPRGDGNGGPGYQIRCEINDAPYERGAVGMALSGKDTGGSQWFATHAPQPHLDGGYTVFGNVVQGMKVVDSIARGDVIRSIVIQEGGAGASRRRR